MAYYFWKALNDSQSKNWNLFTYNEVGNYNFTKPLHQFLRGFWMIIHIVMKSIIYVPQEGSVILVLTFKPSVSHSDYILNLS